MQSAQHEILLQENINNTDTDLKSDVNDIGTNSDLEDSIQDDKVKDDDDIEINKATNEGVSVENRSDEVVLDEDNTDKEDEPLPYTMTQSRRISRPYDQVKHFLVTAHMTVDSSNNKEDEEMKNSR